MKKYARISLCFSFLAFAHCARAVETSTPQTTTEPTPIIAFQTLDIGAQSGCVRAAKMLISSEAEWQRVWALHMEPQQTKTSPPPVDFSRQAVVALLLGERPGGASIQIVQIAQGNTTTIYYAQTPGWKDANTASQPFHFAVIPKPQSTLRFVDANQECAVCVVR